MNSYNNISNSNSANFGIEQMKFNNHYYNMEAAAGSRNYNSGDPYAMNEASATIPRKNGRHDANPNALKNMNYIKKYQSVGQSMNKAKQTLEDEREAHNEPVHSSMKMNNNEMAELKSMENPLSDN